jgi:hypothetical protein
MNDEIFDFSKFDSMLDDWHELYDFNKSYPDNIYEIVSTGFIVDESLYPVIVSYLLSPSALCRRLPLLALYGLKGTGKSTLGKWANVIHFGARWTKSTFSPDDTFAAIRNALSSRKYIGGIERNTMMVWDDISTDVLLRNPSLYQLLKIGYDKSTDTIKIASPNGENIDFHVFSPKIISSVSPWFLDPRLTEIQRRVIAIKTKKIDSLTFDLLNPEDFFWAEFELQLSEYWQDVSRCAEFINNRKVITRRNSKVRKLFTHDSSRWAISHDLIAVMSTLFHSELVQSVGEFNRFWDYFDKEFGEGESSLLSLLRDWIDAQQQTVRIQIQQLKDSGYEPPKELLDALTIKPKMLKGQLADWDRDGRLDMRPNTETVLDAMGQLGYKLTKRGWELRQ